MINDMKNGIKVQAEYQEKDGSWYLNIAPPIYLNGNQVIQDGTWYFKQAFSSKEDAYEMARNYLISIGISQEVVASGIDYE